MGIPVLILGESGSGKSTSMRNFSPDEVKIFNVADKSLPFRDKGFDIQKRSGYRAIVKELSSPKYKRYVIDDSQYLMAFESFQKANVTGYQKFTEMAVHFYNLIRTAVSTPDDVIVYFLHHIEKEEDGKIKAKTIGKMLDNQLTLEGLFSIVLLCMNEDGKHFFVTQSDGNTTAKSPMEMFEYTIDNDLKFVDETIREYYGI